MHREIVLPRRELESVLNCVYPDIPAELTLSNKVELVIVVECGNQLLLYKASCCHIYSYLLLTSILHCTVIIEHCFQILQYYITPVNDFTDLIVTGDLSNIVSRSVFTIVAFLGRVRQRALGK